MRKQIITLFFFLKPEFVGADSLTDSAPIYSAVAHWVTRVWAPSRGPFPILSPLSLSHLISCQYILSYPNKKPCKNTQKTKQKKNFKIKKDYI